MKRKILLAVILIIFVNICGFLLRYYGLDRHIILLGFRFHISLLLPCLLFFQKSAFELIRKSLSEISLRRLLYVFFIALLPPVIFWGGLYLFNITELADPEYFYELGLSSIVDFPLYLIWNLPQMIILGLFLNFITSGKKYKFPLILLIILSLFAFEFIPIGKDSPGLFVLLNFAAAAVLFSIFYSRINNVYYFSVFSFTLLWSHTLLFGSSTKTLVNILLAKNYNAWEGFFSIGKLLSQYTFLIQTGISLILLLFMFVLNFKEK